MTHGCGGETNSSSRKLKNGCSKAGEGEADSPEEEAFQSPIGADQRVTQKLVQDVTVASSALTLCLDKNHHWLATQNKNINKISQRFDSIKTVISS